MTCYLLRDGSLSPSRIFSSDQLYQFYIYLDNTIFELKCVFLRQFFGKVIDSKLVSKFVKNPEIF